jgi:hypothetical protein
MNSGRQYRVSVMPMMPKHQLVLGLDFQQEPVADNVQDRKGDRNRDDGFREHPQDKAEDDGTHQQLPLHEEANDCDVHYQETLQGA